MTLQERREIQECLMQFAKRVFDGQNIRFPEEVEILPDILWFLLQFKESEQREQCYAQNRILPMCVSEQQIANEKRAETIMPAAETFLDVLREVEGK